MPYNNPMNQSIARQVRSIDQGHINRINAISETNRYDVASPLESTTLHHEHVTGGGGYRAATVQDMGFEPTLGATPAGSKKKGGGVLAAGGMSAGGLSAGGQDMAGAGMSAGGVMTAGMAPPPAPTPAEVTKTRKARSKKLPAPPHQTDHLAGGALLTLQDLDKMKGQPPDGPREYITPQAGVGAVNPTGSANLSGSALPLQEGKPKGGKKPRKPNDPSRAPPDEGKPSSMARRNHLVREIMAKHKLSLPQASKHIKEHNLYKKG